MTGETKRAGDPVEPADVPEINARFQEQQKEFDFRYRCGDCINYANDADLCTFGFPTQRYSGGPHRCRTNEGELVFCKYFELS